MSLMKIVMNQRFHVLHLTRKSNMLSLTNKSPQLAIMVFPTALHCSLSQFHTVTTIGNGTFCKSTSLETITFPESVTMIWNKAFEHCISVTSFALPETSKVIGSRAFYGCLHFVPHGTLHVVCCRCATQPSSTTKCHTSHSALCAKRGAASTWTCPAAPDRTMPYCAWTQRASDAAVRFDGAVCGHEQSARRFPLQRCCTSASRALLWGAAGLAASSRCDSWWSWRCWKVLFALCSVVLRCVWFELCCRVIIRDGCGKAVLSLLHVPVWW